MLFKWRAIDRGRVFICSLSNSKGEMGSVRISRQTQHRAPSGSGDPGGAPPANARQTCVEVWASRVDTRSIRSEYAALLIERPRFTSSSAAFDSRLRREPAALIHEGSPLGRRLFLLRYECSNHLFAFVLQRFEFRFPGISEPLRVVLPRF